MLIPKILDIRRKLLLVLVFAGWLTFLACGISVKGHDGENSKVDIVTPIGGIHVNEQVDVRDTGLAVYPGARQRPKVKDGDSKSANVNISSSFFGVKVVAIEFESNDPPSKVLAFYHDQLKKYGDVVECRVDKFDADLTIHSGDDRKNHQPVGCGSNNSGNVVELKVGTNDDQHLVSVEPQGQGSNFALVFIQTRGKEDSI
jgi:hypothetical protein